MGLRTEIEEMRREVEENFRALEGIGEIVKGMGRDVRVMNVKGAKCVTALRKTTDVAIYEMFNSEISRKFKLAQSQFKSSEKSLEAGSVPKRIEKVIDHYVKRQLVPDPEMHVYLLQLERKIGELASHVRNVYNIDNVNLALIGIGFGLIALWKRVEVIEKFHDL